MGAEIWYHSYELQAREALPGQNAPKARVGSLLRVGGGYADLHPWPELGDLPIEEQLRSLAAGHLTPLTRRSLDFAKADAQARSERRSLFSGLEVPNSHRLVTDLSMISSSSGEKQIAQIIEEGFDRIKVKLDWDLDRHLPRLHKLCELLAGSPIKLRLDFNESMKLSDLEFFYSSLDPSELDRIDYLEDPTQFDALSWARMSEIHRSRLAVDRASVRVLDDLLKRPELQEDRILAERPNAVSGPLGFDVWIIKPATEDPKLILRTAANHMERVVFTSYLDHPVGQVFAAWSAAQALNEHPLLVDVCGLLSHRMYEPNDFSEQLGRFGPAFAIPKGTGCGFDEELAVLPWKKLES